MIQQSVCEKTNAVYVLLSLRATLSIQNSCHMIGFTWYSLVNENNLDSHVQWIYWCLYNLWPYYLWLPFWTWLLSQVATHIDSVQFFSLWCIFWVMKTYVCTLPPQAFVLHFCNAACGLFLVKWLGPIWSMQWHFEHLAHLPLTTMSHQCLQQLLVNGTGWTGKLRDG